MLAAGAYCPPVHSADQPFRPAGRHVLHALPDPAPPHRTRTAPSRRAFPPGRRSHRTQTCRSRPAAQAKAASGSSPIPCRSSSGPPTPMAKSITSTTAGTNSPASRPARLDDLGWRQSMHPDDHEPTLAMWRESVATGEPFRIEYRFWDHRDQTLALVPGPCPPRPRRFRPHREMVRHLHRYRRTETRRR